MNLAAPTGFKCFDKVDGSKLVFFSNTEIRIRSITFKAGEQPGDMLNK